MKGPLYGGPSAVWFDNRGNRPAVDTLSTHVWKLVLEAIASGYPLALLLMSFPQKHISCVDVLL